MVTISDFKRNLKNYTDRKSKKIAIVLVDAVYNIYTKKNNLEEWIKNQEHELIV